jgi:hypothetical protein
LARLIAAVLLARVPLHAQGVEVAPFGGYRFGGDFFEIVAGRPVDADGAPALGVVLDFPLSNGFQIEALFTHQQADVLVSLRPLSAPAKLRVSIDHWEGGGLQELDEGQVRPFLTGMLGLTRYAAQGDNEIRFTIGAGGGVKLFPSSRVGARLDGRLFATFIDAGASAVACASGLCFVALHIDVVWQIEFTTGIVVRFP